MKNNKYMYVERDVTGVGQSCFNPLSASKVCTYASASLIQFQTWQGRYTFWKKCCLRVKQLQSEWELLYVSTKSKLFKHDTIVTMHVAG